MEMATLAFVTAIVGTGLSAVGQMRAGQAQEAAAEYNAKLTEKRANQAEYESRQRLKRLMSSQTRSYCAKNRCERCGHGSKVCWKTSGSSGGDRRGLDPFNGARNIGH
jgi:hypothetical protein